MPINQGYKVVVQDKDGVLFSCFASKARIYELNKETKPLPDFGPLAIFTNKQDAKNWARTMFGWNYKFGNVRIFRANYIPSSHPTLWEMNGIFKSSTPYNCLPVGTVLADSITLIEEITNE